MKVLLINGSSNSNGCTYTALQEVSDTLNKNGIETEVYQIGKKPIQGCVSCFSCMKTNKCVFKDDVNEVAEKIEQADALIVGSPVYYASPSGQLVSFLDRLFLSAEGKNFNGKLAAAVVSSRRSGCASTFDVINKYFLMSNMHVVGSQYWNQVHGFTPEDVRKDLEGLQTMRTLGENMAWLLKCIEAGKKSGLTVPKHEEVVLTHFIK